MACWCWVMAIGRRRGRTSSSQSVRVSQTAACSVGSVFVAINCWRMNNEAPEDFRGLFELIPGAYADF
jgi:hypothetical protein